MKTYLWWRLLWADIVPRRVKILTNESEKERFSQYTLYKQTSDTRLELDERKHFTHSKELNIKTNIKRPSDRWMTHISVPVRWTPGFDTTMSDSCTTTANKLPKEQNVHREDQALDDGGTTTCSQPWGAFVLPVGDPVRPGSVAQLRRPYIPAWYWWGIHHVCQGMGHEAVRGVGGVEDGGVEG